MINSPLTNNLNVQKIKSLNAQKIILQYKNDYQVDVSKNLDEIKEVEIFLCNETQLKFYADYYKIAGDGAFYGDLSRNYLKYYNEEKWEFKEVLGYFKPDLKVLEIGSGNGYFLNLLKKHNILNVTGLEISTAAVKNCLEKGFNVINSTIEEYSKSLGQKFDLICSFQVFEHLPNVHSTIESCMNSLNDKGIFIISVPNNESLVFKLDDYHTLNLPPHHVMLWDEFSLNSLCKLYNLELIKIHKSKSTKYEKSTVYKIKLTKLFGETVGKVIHSLTRSFAKALMSDFDGATIIAVYRKK